jgi:UDP-glucose 4-epimerase
MMSKKVTIIGSNGYIGRNFTWYLKSLGAEIFCYDLQPLSFVEDVFYQPVNITVYDQVKKINTNVDLIYVFAGMTGTAQSFIDNSSFIDVNQKGLINILEHMEKCSSKARVVFPSTRLVYKGFKNVSLVEDSEKEPNTIYALTKLACEETLTIYQRIFGINYTVFRICVPYGNIFSGDFSYGTIGFFMKKAKAGENICLYGDGYQRRTFTHIYDLCNILFYASHNSASANQVYNIGGEALSLIFVANLIAEKYQVDIESVPWPKFDLKIESGDTIFDDSKLSNIYRVMKPTLFSEWLKDN